MSFCGPHIIWVFFSSFCDLVVDLVVVFVNQCRNTFKNWLAQKLVIVIINLLLLLFYVR